MKRYGIISILLIYCVLLTGAGRTTAPVLPSRSYYINDYAGVISDEYRESMLDTAESIYNSTGVQIVVLTVESLGGREPEDYAREIFESWDIGGPEDMGVLMLVSPAEAQSHILVGEGLKEALTEVEVSRVENERIVRNFANGDFTKGIYESFRDIVLVMFVGRGEDVTISEEPSGSMAGDAGIYALIVVSTLFIGLRGFRTSARYRQRYSKGYVYKRNTYKRELIPDEDDYPSGFGGAVRVSVREPEPEDLDAETSSGEGRSESRANDERM